MRAELTLTGTRPQLAAFQQTTQSQTLARLDALDEDSYASRLVQHRLLSLWHNATWSGIEAAATVTLTTTGYYAAVREAAETLQRQAREAGFEVQLDLWADACDAQARAEDARIGLLDIA
jgi:hypothetical protein